jgi:hypothetical protein
MTQRFQSLGLRLVFSSAIALSPIRGDVKNLAIISELVLPFIANLCVSIVAPHSNLRLIKP